MRYPHAPAPLLSPDGAFAGVSFADALAIVDTSSGALTDVTLPATDGAAVAFSTDGKRIALHVGGRIAVTSTVAPKRRDAESVECRGAIYRAALGKRLLVAAIRTGEYSMNLGAWRVDGDTLEPLGAAEGLALGASAVYHLHLDEANGRVLLGGISGRGAFSGDGDPFTGIVELTPDLPLIWKGEGLPFRPEGYLYPLAQGQLAITQRNRLAHLDLSALPVVDLLSDTVWDTPLERVAISPNGKHFAWMWAEEGDGVRLRVARFGMDGSTSDVRFQLGGNFPALAVDDEGVATAVVGQRPNLLKIVRIRGEKASPSTVVVPAEPET